MLSVIEVVKIHIICDFRNQNDVSSILDRDAIQIESGTKNPVKAHKFDNFKTQGTFRVGEDNTMGVSNHSNEGTIQQQTQQQQNWNKYNLIYINE